MTTETKTRTLFAEKLIPSHREVGGLMTHRKILLGVYLSRAFGLFIVLMFALLMQSQVDEESHEPLLLFSDALVLIVIVMAFYKSENLYLTRGLSSRPLIVHEDGLTIPPAYFRVFSKTGGFVPKEKIAYITVRRWKKFTIVLEENDGYVWYNAPVEFVVHQTNGWRRRSGPRPAEVIMASVDTMQRTWGIKVVHKGSGNGMRKRFIDRKCVEVVEL